MPTLYELLTNPVSLTVFAIYIAIALWECFAPARRLPAVRGWTLRGLAAFAGYFMLSSYLPFLWTEQFIAWQLVDLSSLPTWAGALVGLVVNEAFVYAWHRSMHRTDLLFRGLHQWHHSAERHDVIGAFWFSPLDMVGWTLLSSIALTLVVGLSAEAAVWVLYAGTTLNIFQHANVRTPRWLGYVVQRPESHSVHHERGVHAFNYCSLPLIDMLFGTFRNPPSFAREQGFWPGASSRIGDMLAWRDISQPPEARDDALLAADA